MEVKHVLEYLDYLGLSWFPVIDNNGEQLTNAICITGFDSHLAISACIKDLHLCPVTSAQKYVFEQVQDCVQIFEDCPERFLWGAKLRFQIGLTVFHVGILVTSCYETDKVFYFDSQNR